MLGFKMKVQREKQEVREAGGRHKREEGERGVVSQASLRRGNAS